MGYFNGKTIKHEGHEVHKAGLSDRRGSLFKTLMKEGQKEVIIMRNALIRSGLFVLCV